MGDHLGCGTRTKCRSADDEQVKTLFNHMEADLHNLFPAMKWANGKRSNHPFGLLSSENHFFEDCDFDVGTRARDGATIIEPRPQARGEVARAIFYMHQEYSLPVDPPLGELLKQWNRDDPPSWDEIRRNKKINELQGTRNPFIANPALEDDLQF